MNKNVSHIVLSPGASVVLDEATRNLSHGKEQTFSSYINKLYQGHPRVVPSSYEDRCDTYNSLARVYTRITRPSCKCAVPGNCAICEAHFEARTALVTAIMEVSGGVPDEKCPPDGKGILIHPFIFPKYFSSQATKTGGMKKGRRSHKDVKHVNTMKVLTRYKEHLNKELLIPDKLLSFENLRNNKHLGCFCLEEGACHVGVILEKMKELDPTARRPGFVCLKRNEGLLKLPVPVDNIKDWMSKDGNQQCIRGGRLWITKTGPLGDKVKDRFQWKSSEWCNPFKWDDKKQRVVRTRMS